MGCCQSSAEESRPITSNSNNRSSAAVRKGKEDKIELAFKAKRANVFTEGVDLGRNAFSIKRVPKNAKQTQLIRKCPRLLICRCGPCGDPCLSFLSVCHRSKLYFCVVEFGGS
jgi:hypothetical protein